jgi:hypothetical protein
MRQLRSTVSEFVLTSRSMQFNLEVSACDILVTDSLRNPRVPGFSIVPSPSISSEHGFFVKHYVVCF